METRFFAAALVLAFAVDAAAGPAAVPPATGILAKVQAFYARTTDFKASFKQVVRTRSPKRTFTRSGTVWFQRPNRMRWDYQVPDKVHYVSDGEVLWSYDVEEAVAYRLPVKDSELYQALGFLTGTTRLADSFDGVEQPATAGGLVPVILTPRQPSGSYQSITLFVDPATGETRETEVLDPLGNISRVRFDDPTFGPLPASGFTFKVPAGVRVQELGSK
jgi:outer membrane lipoprotein carrier protein